MCGYHFSFGYNGCYYRFLTCCFLLCSLSPQWDQRFASLSSHRKITIIRVFLSRVGSQWFVSAVCQHLRFALCFTDTSINHSRCTVFWSNKETVKKTIRYSLCVSLCEKLTFFYFSLVIKEIVLISLWHGRQDSVQGWNITI